jgi:hypothetical protein
VGKAISEAQGAQAAAQQALREFGATVQQKGGPPPIEND